jgi:hypothetical protein
MDTHAEPRVIVTVGLHGSASTWVFNVVRELLIASVGEGEVLALYADRASELPDDVMQGRRRHVVVKSHHGSADLDDWLAAARSQIVMSIRDPRDACLSMAQRFRARIEDAARWLAKDCRRVLRLAAGNPPLLRYEDRFFDDPSAVGRLADTLGVSVSPADLAAIAARYRTEAVRSFAQRLAQLPRDRVTEFASSHLLDQVTQIHGVHIGDARSGKWRELPQPVRDQLTRFFGEFLDRFEYPR